MDMDRKPAELLGFGLVVNVANNKSKPVFDRIWILRSQNCFVTSRLFSGKSNEIRITTVIMNIMLST